MALPASDAFDNTGGAAVSLSVYSANWTIERGTFTVPNGTDDCRSTGSGITSLARWNADTFNANQRSTAKISATPSGLYPGVAARVQSGAATGYVLLVSDNYYEFDRIDAGTENTLTSGTGAVASGDIIRLEVETIDASTVQLRYYHAPAATPTTFTLRATYNDTSASRITSAGYAGVSGYGDNGSTVGVDDWQGDNLGAAATHEQEGFRFGVDDGSESAHTWAAAQDADTTQPLGTNLLLRMLVNATNDPAATAYTLRYKRSDEGTYATVPVGATTAPTLSYGGAGTTAYSAASGTTVAPAYPSNITANSALVLIIGQKPSSANGGTVTTPSGWTLQTSKTGANDGDTGGYTTTLGADTGNTNIFVYTKDTVTGSESGTLSVTVGTNDVCWAVILRLQSSDSCTWSWAGSVGKDTSAGSVSITTDAGIAIASGDLVIGGMVIPTDVTTPSQFSAEAFAQTGTTFATATELTEPDSTTGNDIGGFLCYATISSGSGSGAVTLSATAGGTTTNVRGPGFVLRARVASVSNRIYIAPSSNITAGGEATTARLTAPSGKTTSNFTTGRRWDDENGADSVDIASGNYSEFEWCLQAQSPAANAEVYQFRVYAGTSALDTYTLTPQWTIGTGGGSVTSVQVARGRTLSRGLGRGLQ